MCVDTQEKQKGRASRMIGVEKERNRRNKSVSMGSGKRESMRVRKGRYKTSSPSSTLAASLSFFFSFLSMSVCFFFFSFLSGGEYPSDTSYKDFGHCIGTSAGNVWFGGMKGDIMYRLIKFLAMRSDFLNTSFTV